MTTHLRELLALQSTRIIAVFTICLKLTLGLGILFTSKPGTSILIPITAGDDTTPFLIGILSVVAITGYFSHGTIVLDILANPNKLKIQLRRISAVSIVSVASLILAYLINWCIIEAIVVIGKLQLSFVPLQNMLFSLLNILLLAITYSLIGSGLGFTIISTAGTIFVYLGIMWGLPILAALSGAINPLLIQHFLQYTPASLTIWITSSQQLHWYWGVIGLFIWSFAIQLLGIIRLRTYKPWR
ncbi:hypothetical protein HMPREF9156_00873 [Scardovia wiggsiae F0424]|uniref:ABC-2 type transporter domain-containing protein n=1 Tax=Scardovia wiggsiae F0424 TaxID=857290 RepID=J0DFC6_9BIFI|nr:hypothetical protein HMPREF9156_00873 [Scardovia wiggsiae F0424]